jgi:hypothetical protein
MPDAHPRTDLGGGFLIGGMNDRTILYVGLFTNTNAVYVAPTHGLKPNRTPIT